MGEMLPYRARSLSTESYKAATQRQPGILFAPYSWGAMVAEFRYDAFISYSREADAGLVAPLRDGLAAYAKPWWRRRALRVFSDSVGLSTGAGLSSALQAAMSESKYLILLASASAARSTWVDLEVEYWLEHREPRRILIAVTEDDPNRGANWISWDRAENDFDWARTRVLPSRLAGVFADEPVYAFVGAGHRARPSGVRDDPLFQNAVVDLSAAIRGVPKEDLVGEDVSQRRRTRLTAAAAIILILLFAAGSLVFGTSARRQSARANQASLLAAARSLSSQALAPQTPVDQSLLLAAHASELHEGADTRGALLQRVAATRYLTAAYHANNVVDAVISEDGAKFALLTRDGASRQMAGPEAERDAVTILPVAGRTGSRRTFAVPQHTRRVLFVDPDGSALLTLGEQGSPAYITWYTTRTGRQLRQVRMDSLDPGSASISGHRLVIAQGNEFNVVDTETGTLRTLLIRRANNFADYTTVGLGGNEWADLRFDPTGGVIGVRVVGLADGHSRMDLPFSLMQGAFASELQISPDGSVLLLTQGTPDDRGGAITAFDIASSRELWTTKRDAAPVGVAFSRTLNQIISVWTDRSLIRYSPRTGAFEGPALPLPARPTLETMNHAGTLVGVADANRNVLLYQLAGLGSDGAAPGTRFGIVGIATGPVFSSTGRFLAIADSASADGPENTEIRVFDVRQRRLIRTIRTPVDALVFGKDDASLWWTTCVAPAGHDVHCSVLSADIRGGTPHPIDLPTGVGERVLTASPDGSVAVSLGTRVFVKRPHGELASTDLRRQVNDAAFSTDGKFLLVLTDGDRLTVLRLGEHEITPIRTVGDVAALRMSPDRTGSVAVSTSSPIRIINWHDGSVQEIQTDTPTDPDEVAASMDGSTIAYVDVGPHAAVVLWDGTAHLELGTMDVPDDLERAWGIALSPDGATLALSGAGALYLWDLRVPSLVRRICQLTTTDLTLDEWRDFAGPLLHYQPVCDD